VNLLGNGHFIISELTRLLLSEKGVGLCWLVLSEFVETLLVCPKLLQNPVKSGGPIFPVRYESGWSWRVRRDAYIVRGSQSGELSGNRA